MNLQKLMKKAQKAKMNALAEGREPIYHDFGYGTANGPGRMFMGWGPPKTPPQPKAPRATPPPRAPQSHWGPNPYLPADDPYGGFRPINQPTAPVAPIPTAQPVAAPVQQPVAPPAMRAPRMSKKLQRYHAHQNMWGPANKGYGQPYGSVPGGAGGLFSLNGK